MSLTIATLFRGHEGRGRRESAIDGRRRALRRRVALEALEGRSLMDMGIGQIAAGFNAGIQQVQSGATALVRAWDRDIADVPLLQKQPMAGLLIDQSLAKAIGKTVSVTDSADALLADLKRRGFQVSYLGTTPDASGNYLVASQPIALSNLTRSLTVGGPEGFLYLDRAAGSLSGSIKGSVGELAGSLTYVVRDDGFLIRTKDSRLSGNFSLAGQASGRQDIGLLKGVNIGGSVSFAGAFGLRFKDDGDGLLTPAQMVTDASLLGSLSGKLSYRPTFKATLPGLSPISWTGDFDRQIKDAKTSGDENFDLPSYRAVADQFGLALISDLRSQSWFKQVDAYLNKKIPVLDKTLGDLLKIKDKTGGFLAGLGIAVLNDAQGRAAMMKLIKGEMVELVSIKRNGSIDLWSSDVIPSIPLAYGSIIPGLLDYRLGAFLKADLDLTYRVDAGVNTLGLYYGTATGLGIAGRVSGGVEGSLRTAGYDWLEGTGSLTLDVGLNVGLYDADGDGRVYQSQVGRRVADSLVTTLDIDLGGEVKGKLDLYFKKVTVFKKSFKIADLYDVSFGPSGRPPVTNMKALVQDTLPADPDRLPTTTSLPAAPANLRLGAVAPTSIELKWDDHSNNEYAFRVAISRDGGKTWDNVAATPANKTSVRIDGLAPGSRYHFKIRAVNSQGYSAYSNMVDATTAGIPPASPANLRASAVATRSIDLKWDDRSNNEAEFRVAISRDGGATWDNVGVVGANATSFRVGDLNPNTRYLFKVRASNAAGHSGYTNVVEATTAGEAPVNPYGLRLAGTTATTIELAWDDRSNNETGFEVFMSADGGRTERSVGRTSANQTTFSATGLNPATTYRFAVKAYNAVGHSAYSNTIEAVTGDVAPTAPANLRVDNLWARTIDLRWDDRSGNEAEFRVAISRDGGATWDNIAVLGADATSFRVGDLKPNTRYLFKVRAANAAGYSDYANIVDVTTREEAPAAPANLRVDNLWAKTIDLRWDDRSGNEAEFRVAISRDGGATWDNIGVVGTDATSLRVGDLKPRTRYLFKVRASNAAGFSDYSNILDVTTRA